MARRKAGAVMAAVILAVLPGAARGDGASSLRLTVTPAKDRVALGEGVAVQVQLKNEGKKPVSVTGLELDPRSLYFRVGEGGRDFRVGVIAGGINQPTEIPSVTIPAGESVSCKFEIPTFSAGAWEITAKYNGTSKDILWADTLSSAPAVVTVEGKDGAAPYAVLETSKGRIVARFYPDEAPNTVINFMRLASGGSYDGLTFHRIIKGFMIQGGDPKGDGSGGPGYSIPAEFGTHKHTPGVLSMARSQNPDSAGQQFFICLGTPTHLDGQYTAFGEVVEGIEVVQAIGEVKTGPNDRPVEKVVITKARIEVR